MKMSERQSTLSVRVQPRSSRNAMAGWRGDTLKITLTAPPVNGAANAACLAFLAELLEISASQLTVLKGAHSRTKVVRLSGLSQEKVESRLGRPSSRLVIARGRSTSR